MTAGTQITQIRAHTGGTLTRQPGRAEIASAALLLTDPASSYLTGVILPVDGGWTAH